MRIPSRRQILAGALVAPFAARAQSAPDDIATLDLQRVEAEGFVTISGATDLRVKKGEEVRLRVANGLDQPTALHVQGLRGPAAMDGAAGLTQAPIAPGATFDYRFTPPDSGFYWYRASAFPQAVEQRALGLHGFIIVEDANPPDVDLDLPIAIDDWALNKIPAATLATPFLDPVQAAREGRMGPGLGLKSALVVARPDAGAIVTLPEEIGFGHARPGLRARLRLVNACNARVLLLIFENMRPVVVAVDGQPCDPFEPLRAVLPLGPGARFEVIVDLPREAGAVSRLKSRGGGLRLDPKGEADSVLLEFNTAGEPLPVRPPVATLGLNPLLPPVIPLEKAKKLDLVIEGPSKDPARPWTINGGAGAIGGKPLFSVPRGQAVSLGFVNKTPVFQSPHVHGHVMRVLHPLDDGWEPYWRDAALVPPGRTVRVAFLADNPGKWLIDSTILDHAATGVSAWFEVT